MRQLSALKMVEIHPLDFLKSHYFFLRGSGVENARGKELTVCSG
jgi:hypothetical protein